MIDPLTICVVLLVVYILWAIFTPPKALVARRQADLALENKKNARKYVRHVPIALGINSIKWERGSTTGYRLITKPCVIYFPKVHHGDFSETVYAIATHDGTIDTYEHMDQALAAYDGDAIGIVACTVSDGEIKFRDILPNGLAKDQLTSVRFEFAVQTK